jgi:hypothetical protein
MPLSSVVPPVGPVAAPAAVGAAHVDIRSLEAAAIAGGKDVYFVRDMENVLDSGCSLRAMTGAGSAGIMDVRDLAPHECTEVTGIGGKVRITQSGKKAHRILVELYDESLELQQMLADLQVEFLAMLTASGQAADPLYYYFVLEYLINPCMRPDLSLLAAVRWCLILGGGLLLIRSREPAMHCRRRMS